MKKYKDELSSELEYTVYKIVGADSSGCQFISEFTQSFIYWIIISKSSKIILKMFVNVSDNI
jgi:hypothetical protein